MLVYYHGILTTDNPTLRGEYIHFSCIQTSFAHVS